MKICARITVILLAACGALFAQQKQTIAVMDLEANAVTEEEAGALSNELRSQIINKGIYRVVERGQLETILKEQGFQQSGACNDNACLDRCDEVYRFRLDREYKRLMSE